MKPEAQQIAIGKACGSTRVNGYSDYWMPPGIPWLPETDKRKRFIPDYLNDLNAMNEAFLYLVSISEPYSARRQPDVHFKLFLMKICCPGVRLWDNGKFLGNIFHGLETTNATASQRAEAFLRTLGKWVED